MRLALDRLRASVLACSLAAAASAVLVACKTDHDFDCHRDQDCAPGMICWQEICQPPFEDTGAGDGRDGDAGCVRDEECGAGEWCRNLQCVPRESDAGGDPDSRGDGCLAAPEVCDGADNDCDGEIDEPSAMDASDWYPDIDGDGWGRTGDATRACNAPANHVDRSGDCDDGDDATHPGADESCTEDVDRNCDGSVAREDADDDGFASCEECNDVDADIHPDASEIVGDGVDQDCDGGEICHVNADGDGFRTAAPAASTDTDCSDPGEATAALPAGDCDDADSSIYPGADELCGDSADNDCDGDADEDDAVDTSTWYEDDDADGWGLGVGSRQACTRPLGWVAQSGDCDDADAAFHPSAEEPCTEPRDLDCDGESDFVDADEDGHAACADCDDSDPTIHRASDEVIGDGIDSDCDGTELCWADTDNDGYHDGTTVVSPNDSCAESGEAGNSAPSEDCAPADPAIHPGMDETCEDGIDSDCSGRDITCRLTGAIAWDDADVVIQAGEALANGGMAVTGGDIDGDGFGDVVIGAPLRSMLQGGVSIAWGARDPSSTIAPGDLVTLSGSTSGGTAGRAVAAGDTNGDGFADVLVGAPSDDSSGSNAGAVFILYGSEARLVSGTLPVDRRLTGPLPSIGAGSSVLIADLDGDGPGELLVGASRGGLAYVVAGTRFPLSSFSLGLASTVVFAPIATFGDALGATDLLGDGGVELLIGAPEYSAGPLTEAGFVAGIGDPLGSVSIDLGTDPDRAVRFEGETSGDFAGTALATGDVSGDGRADMVIGAPGEPPLFGDASAVWNDGRVFLIRAGDAFANPESIGRGTDFSGELGSGAGWRVAAGDVDGDGIDDVLVGAPGLDHGGTRAGGAHLIYGASPRPAGTELGALTTVACDEPDAWAGFAVAVVDFNGDGFGDLVVCAPRADATATDSGECRVFFGGDG